MTKSNFTTERVAAFQCESGKQQSILSDGKTPGLGLRATAAGAKSYIFESRLHGKTLRMTIGDVRTWPIGKAQAEATRLKTLIDQGIDPRQERADKAERAQAKHDEAQRAEAPALPIWRDYIESRRSRWSASHLRDHETVCKAGGEPRTRGRRKGESDKTQPGALLPLLELPLQNIDVDAVRAWLVAESPKRPTHARLAFGLLRAFLGWCADRPEYRDQTHPDACATRLAREELPKKQAKDDCLQREQLPLWFEHVRKLNNPVHAAYLQGLLLTGARREELACVKWSDIDFQWNSLTIRDKVEGTRTIPLTPFVSSLLASLPRRNEWVFSSPTAAAGRLAEPRIGHNKALAAAGLPALSLHGLRRSFGTLAEWVECPAGVSAQIMGHKPSATAEKHYRRRPIDLLRVWHTKIEEWILEQAGVSFAANVQVARLQLVS